METNDFTRTMLDRADKAFSHDTEQRQRVVSDMKFAFVAGHQWDAHLTKKRRNRPCYEFNRLRQMIRRVTGQQLQNKPQIKVRPVEDGDVDTAEILNGLIRNIEVNSGAENAYDTAFQWSCGGGYGVLRVVTEYESDYTFNQCLKIKAVYDPTTVYCDPSAKEFDRRDAEFWFITDKVSRSEYKRRWPKAEVVDFKGPANSGLQRGWWDQDEVRIAEYWYKEPAKKLIYLLDDGTVVSAEEFDPIAEEAAAAGLNIKDKREVDTHIVKSVLVSGKGPLEEPTEWPGTCIPIVPQWGDLLTIDGRQIYSGMTRFGRDAQTIHNFELSTLIEVVAKLPNSPLKATPKMIEGLKPYYERLGYDDPPVLLYNADPDAPGGSPQREPMAQFPAALANLSAMATDEMKATLGIYDASLGAKSNETSGRAIIARQNEGETSNFVYIDNQVKAIKRIGEILVDAIPRVYDAERSIRILGEDGAEKFVKVNRVTLDEQTGEQIVINDLSRGRYDVAVTVGKNFDTARMEIAEAAQAMVGTPGPFGLMAQYLLLQNLDVPGLDEFKKAARKVLVQQGLLDAGEGDQPPAPPQPNPKDVASAENQAAQAQLNQAKAIGQQIENAMQTMAVGMPPPPPDPQFQAMPTDQPPQGGFFVPETPEPGGFPG
jgi:hypothetical protein